MRERWTVILILLGIAGALALIFRERLTELSSGQVASLIYGLMALALVGGGVFASRGGISRNWLSHLALWLAIMLGLALAYTALAPYLPPQFGTR
jgi:hypothetical protein